MLSNYQKVRDFNISFGIGRSVQPDNKLFKLRWDLIEEEANELFDALNNKDYIEVIDAVSDILYVVFGASDSFEYDIDNDINNPDESIDNIISRLNLKLSPNVEQMRFGNDRMKLIFENEIEIKKLNKLKEDFTYELFQLSAAFDIKKIPVIIKHLVIIHNYMYAFAYLFGFDLDHTFDLVHQSNMSKLAETEEIARMTVKWYMNNEPRYDSPAYRLSTVLVNEEQRWVIYNYNTGKALKSINYQAVNFNHLF
jgi:predicted HAD superfamily Cof-like phosphohydrolase